MPETLSKTKLTLWVDKETKRFGKEWAKRHGESFSHVLSSYLQRLREAEKIVSADTPIVGRLSGKPKKPGDNRKDYGRHLEKKYFNA